MEYLIGLGLFSLGIFLGSNWIYIQRNNYIEIKSNKENRTPMCVKGKFYYVVPEKEYFDGLK